jgi:nicotinamide-nucleotide amidase
VKVELIAVGTELLLGDVINTNASWLGGQLALAGFDLMTQVVVGDNVARISDAVTTAASRADVVVVTGGLGPTRDDLTREALAAAAGVKLSRDPTLETTIRAAFAAHGRRMPPDNLRQADLPTGATPLDNGWGTAPGVCITIGGSTVYALPGVPREMQRMFTVCVMPELRQRSPVPSIIVSRTLNTCGVGESTVAEALVDLDRELDPVGNPTVAYLASAGETRVRITAKAVDSESAEQLIAPVEAEVRRRLGPVVYGIDDDSLDRVVHRLLAERSSTLAVAESVTGGQLGGRLADMPGASQTFLGGVITYATEAKRSLLGINGELLQRVGAVHADVARAMAREVRLLLKAEVGLAIVGVAGPESQDGYPVGTVIAAIALPDGSEAVSSRRVSGDRGGVRRSAVTMALDLTRRSLLGLPPGSDEINA